MPQLFPRRHKWHHMTFVPPTIKYDVTFLPTFIKNVTYLSTTVSLGWQEDFKFRPYEWPNLNYFSFL
jgi:hypothetical protein